MIHFVYSNAGLRDCARLLQAGDLVVLMEEGLDADAVRGAACEDFLRVSPGELVRRLLEEHEAGRPWR